ncbi:CGNR zinc finger domain-containing protein [Labrys okinawensis]|uniref:CGNR zinc finger domain-containing protein n=1 Tax=Labrys okinawensis TaxID=346911 RepID=UPI0039BD668A
MLSHSSAVFIADSTGLDFLNSISTPVDVPVETLEDGEGLLAWLDKAKLVPTKVLEHFRSHTVPGELDGVAAQARSLREWFRAFVLERKGRPLTGADLKALEPLNRLLAREEDFKAVALSHEDDEGPFILETNRRWRAPESLLLPLGESLARLVCEESFADVKACEGHDCTLIFVDHTRGRHRRWCSMAVCGNRAKQAAHRNRILSKAAGL